MSWGNLIAEPVTATALRVVELTGIGVASVSGALTALRKRLDVFGIVVAALVTAVGGGTLRDLLLGRRPVAWMRNPWGIVLAVVVALATAMYTRGRKSPELRWLLIADAFVLAFFTIAGTRIALEEQQPLVTAVLIGMVSGVAGGIVRDVLCNEVPLVFRGELYAIASLAGGFVYVSLWRLGATPLVATLAAIAFITVLRIAAFTWHLRLPVLQNLGHEEE